MKLIEDMTDWEKQQAIHSARYILGSFFDCGKNGVEMLGERLIIPDKEVHEALENIFCAEIKL